MGQSLSNFYTALKWIINVFNKHSINYQLVGGVAAYVYGSERKINDIDFYIDFSELKKIHLEIKKFTTWGPLRWKDENWDITFLKMVYRNQKIEIGDITNCFIYSKKENRWIKQHIDLTDYNNAEVDKIAVKIMKKEKLIAYKSLLEREVDLQDIEQIK